MTTYAFVAPVLAGKKDQLRNLTTQLTGEKLADAEALRRVAGLEREQVFLQETPMGDFAIIVWDTTDIVKVFDTFATDTSQTSIWFRQQLLEIHGIDVADVNNQPHMTIGFDWHAPTWSFGDAPANYAISFPVAPGKEQHIVEWADELATAHKEGFVRTREQIGVTRQTFIRQMLPDGTAVAIMYGEGTPGWINRGWELNGTSTDEFYTWFRESLKAVAAVPLFEGSAPSVECILDLTVKVPARV